MVELNVNDKTFSIAEKKRVENLAILDVDGTEVGLEVLPVPGLDSSTMLVRVGERLLMCRRTITPDGQAVQAWVNDRPLHVELVNRHAMLGSARAKAMLSNGPVTVEAPMAGRIVEVKASPGSEAKEGQPLVVLEAMKMENEIAAPKDGRVREVHVKVGALVRPGDKLVVID